MKSLSLLFSIIAISVAVMAFCGNPFSSTSDASLTVVAICTTMIVGFSIIDRREIKELQQNMQEQNKITNTIKDNLKDNLKDVKIAISVTWGLIRVHENNYLPALYHFLNGFKTAIENNDACKASTCMNQIKELYSLQWAYDYPYIQAINKLLTDISLIKLSVVFKDDIEKINTKIKESKPNN